MLKMLMFCFLDLEEKVIVWLINNAIIRWWQSMKEKFDLIIPDWWRITSTEIYSLAKFSILNLKQSGGGGSWPLYISPLSVVGSPVYECVGISCICYFCAQSQRMF